MMLTASGVTISAVVLAYQLVLPRIWSGFQLVGSAADGNDAALNGVILGAILIVFTTIVNAIGVRLMARIDSAGVFIELIAAVAISSRWRSTSWTRRRCWSTRRVSAPTPRAATSACSWSRRWPRPT